MIDMKECTKKLLLGIESDLIPESVATLMDFGLDEKYCEDITRAFGAYQFGIKQKAFTMEELDAALGDGLKLTELVNRVAPVDLGIEGVEYLSTRPNPYGQGLTINTVWDAMPEED